MSLSVSFSQASLAATILASTIGTYIALSPPNPSANPIPSTGDSIRWLHLTRKHSTAVALIPLGLLALHTSALVYLHPDIPSSVLRHGAENGLNDDLITWSAATSIPLALIFCAGLPLRLISYGELGKDFTFALSKPSRLTTTGIYRYVQHPSYTGIVILVLCNLALLSRIDGVLSCWHPPRWHQAVRSLESTVAALVLSVLVFAVCTRVRQEESMLRAEIGVEWERWHARTARFIPWVL
ncbi:hypothetical protein BJ170DRAFT_458860 [Xylariales sp. AK1849]|nr:hypothetical protein BJ170DRAFT_458860 [Xylariales sp. AK1849]